MLDFSETRLNANSQFQIAGPECLRQKFIWATFPMTLARGKLVLVQMKTRLFCPFLSNIKEIPFHVHHFYILLEWLWDMGKHVNVDHCWPFTLIPVFAFPLQPMVDPQTPIFASKSQLAINHRGLWVGGGLVWHVAPLVAPVHLKVAVALLSTQADIVIIT